MHNIAPWHRWRDKYESEADENSPFYGRTYSDSLFEQRIYNYYIHPEWDFFGAETLYAKVLFANYDDGYAIIELIGEWNDCLHNDIMFLKRDLADSFIEAGVHRFVFICENVLNFHSDDDCYYEEWYDDIKDDDGWIVLLNTHAHVADEMKASRLDNYLFVGDHFNDIN